jgi:predicted permease
MTDSPALRGSIKTAMANLAYWLFTIVFLEGVLHAAVFDTFSLNFLFVVGFGSAFAALLSLLTSFLPKKASFAVTLLLTVVLMVLFGSQIVYNAVFGSLYSIAMLALGGDALGAFWKETLLTMAENLLPIGLLFVPLVLLLIVWRKKPAVFLPDSFRSLFSYLGSLCTPLSMLITGANLARRDLKKMFTSKPVYLVNFVKLIVMPLVITTLMWLLGFSDTIVLFSAVMAALPCAAVVTMFGEMYSITPGYAAELVGSTSILCIATLFPMIWYAQFLVTL